MPEPYWPKRKSSYTLSEALHHARYARIRCRFCKLTRYFLLADLKVAYGNIEVDDVVYQQQWRCTGCRKSDALELRLEDPPSTPGKGVVVRHLVRVDYVRRPVWRDEKTSGWNPDGGQ